MEKMLNHNGEISKLFKLLPHFTNILDNRLDEFPINAAAHLQMPPRTLH